MSDLMPSDLSPGAAVRESTDPSGEALSRNVLRRYLCQTDPAAGSFLLLAGPSGSGKSAVVRDVIDALNEETGTGTRRALLEVHLPGESTTLSEKPLLTRLRSLVQRSLHQGQHPVLLVDNLPSTDVAMTVVDRLRRALPVPTMVVGTTADLTGAAEASPTTHLATHLGATSRGTCKSLLHSLTLSAWETRQRAAHISPPHPDLLDIAVSYLRQHPSDAWPGALTPLSGQSGSGTTDTLAPSPRDWTLALEDHARLLCLTARYGDGGEWGSYIAEIYQRYLSAPIGSRFLEFFGQQPLPSGRQILLEGEPPRFGWRHPLTLPDLAADMGQALPSVLDESHLNKGTELAAEPDHPAMYPLSRFGGFLNDFARYGQYLAGEPVSTDPAAGAGLLLPGASTSRLALMERVTAAFRPALPALRERLESLAASGLTLPPPLARFMEVTTEAGGTAGTHTISRSVPPSLRPGFHR